MPLRVKHFTMIFRFLSVGLLMIGLVLVGVAASNYFTVLDNSRVVVPDAERALPECSPDEPIPVFFRIHNPTRFSVRVVGLEEC